MHQRFHEHDWQGWKEATLPIAGTQYCSKSSTLLHFSKQPFYNFAYYFRVRGEHNGGF